MLSDDGTKRLHLSDQQYLDLTQELEMFRCQIASPIACVISSSGMMVAKAGKARDKALVLLSTLASANFASSAQMAKLLGEKHGFIAQCYEGERFSIYLHGAGEDYLIAAVFGKKAPLSVVQHFSNIYCARFQRILERINTDGSFRRQKALLEQELGRREFEEELSDKLGRVLAR